MTEIDYQMALLLQHRFEQEQRTMQDAHIADQELARQLQEQFEQEETLEHPTSNLVYANPKTKALPKEQGTSKCLVDPSWELVDPTPDIHILFTAFSERFFWNKLFEVCVSWSKRMTSCAGVCSYGGRGGICSITLSEPLLKLRPRKDLVETLLHEMIHAYLFVTHNNRDRDGHGPEFHKHMRRINAESGTNITVYHDFHDEVRLYQQHWWRCNGPCQHRKPYFGMVRRATNRAPGVNDRWWGEHLRNCGGTFIKVKEPEKKVKKGAKTEKKVETTVGNKDIRKFFVPNDKTNTQNNIRGIKDVATKVKGKFNSASTIVVTKGTKTDGNNFSPTLINPSKDKDPPRGSTSSNNYSDDFISVRKHWANKFCDTTSSNKRPALPEPSTSNKIRKISEPDHDSCSCPVCNKSIKMQDLNSHLDACLNVSNSESSLTKEEIKECHICNTLIESSMFDSHAEKCLNSVFDKHDLESEATVSCLSCGKNVLKKDLNSHLDECMRGIFDVKDEEKDPERASNSQFNCPFCMKLVEELDMKVHLDRCLSNDEDIQTLLEEPF